MARMVCVYIRYIYDICFPMLKQKAGLLTNENWSKNKLTVIALRKVNF